MQQLALETDDIASTLRQMRAAIGGLDFEPPAGNASSIHALLVSARRAAAAWWFGRACGHLQCTCWHAAAAPAACFAATKPRRKPWRSRLLPAPRSRDRRPTC